MIGLFPVDAVGLAVTDLLNRRFGSDRDLAEQACADEAARLLLAGDWRRFPAGERLAWRRLSPIALMLPGLTRWSPADRRALKAIMRAKGSRFETTYVDLVNRHPRLHRALTSLGRRSHQQSRG